VLVEGLDVGDDVFKYNVFRLHVALCKCPEHKGIVAVRRMSDSDELGFFFHFFLVLKYNINFLDYFGVSYLIFIVLC